MGGGLIEPNIQHIVSSRGVVQTSHAGAPAILPFFSSSLTPPSFHFPSLLLLPLLSSSSLSSPPLRSRPPIVAKGAGDLVSQPGMLTRSALAHQAGPGGARQLNGIW